MKWYWFFVYAIVVIHMSTVSAEDGQLSTDDLCERAVQVLRQSLQTQEQWVKVHAAEALLALSYGDNVQQVFEQEQKQHGNELEYRVGIWRVLAQAAPDKAQRDFYVDKIRDVLLNAENPDGTHAAETLGKLDYQIPRKYLAQFQRLAEDPTVDGAHCRRWVVAGSGDDDDVRKLAEMLDDSNAKTRGITAYALRFLNRKLPGDVRERLAQLAEQAMHKPASPDQVYLVSAAYLTSPNQRTARFKELLLPYAISGNKDERYEAASALALRGDQDDLTLLEKLLDDSEPDVRVSAANAILRIDRRANNQDETGRPLEVGCPSD